MNVGDFDFDLPVELIAQAPRLIRDSARLLVLDRATGDLRHSAVADLPRWLTAGDLLVVNNTRVIPARLLGHREPSGGAVECLLLARMDSPAGGSRDEQYWHALVHPGQKLKPGAKVVFDPESGKANPQPRLRAEVLEWHHFGRRVIRLRAEGSGGAPTDVDALVDAMGHTPLPPYIRRADAPADRESYQTVYARARGSVAAPTAGLHFTPELLRTLGAGGVETAEITLHVGYGTFQPVRVARVENHRLEAEPFEISAEAASRINRALDDRRRVIAVGTTTTRTLEAVARQQAIRIEPTAGTTDLFIYPGFVFRAVGGLLTNFHLPKSSLLMLVCAFAGRDRVLAAYQEAVREGYRFYSYGDAMLIL